MLKIAYKDVKRATLSELSGNEGWIGVSPDGADYHVVVPVDRQIARGVMACNYPTDGTPFGGYSGWLYFRCPPYEDNGEDDPSFRERQTGMTAKRLIDWLGTWKIEAACDAGGEGLHVDGAPIG